MGVYATDFKYLKQNHEKILHKQILQKINLDLEYKSLYLGSKLALYSLPDGFNNSQSSNLIIININMNPSIYFLHETH